MRNVIKKILVLMSFLMFINNLIAQKNRIVIKIEPTKKVFSLNDTAYFKTTFINRGKSIVRISRLPTINGHDYFDITPQKHSEDIYVYLQKQNNDCEYKPFSFSISGDFVYVPPDIKNSDSAYHAILKMKHAKSIKDSILHKESVLINSNDSVTMLLNFFPFKLNMDAAKYKARISYFTNNKKPYKLVTSNWTEFIFEETLIEKYIECGP